MSDRIKRSNHIETINIKDFKKILKYIVLTRDSVKCRGQNSLIERQMQMQIDVITGMANSLVMANSSIERKKSFLG